MKKTENTFYTCPYCGKEYNDPVDLAHCILSCEELERKNKEEEKKKKLEAEKEARRAEIDETLKKYIELRDAYIKDYGYYFGSYSNTANMKDKDWEDFWKLLKW